MIMLAGRLALADLAHERRLFVCFVFGLAAVLAPLLVLFGLKVGVIDALRRQLLDDPRTREIVSVGNRGFDRQWFDTMQARSEIAFVMPRTRSLAATIELSPSGSAAVLTVDLVATAAGDPLLGTVTAPADQNGIVLSRSAAERLGVAGGVRLDAVATRIIDGRREALRLAVQVGAVLAPEAYPRPAAFATLGLLEAVEDYRDNTAAGGGRLYAGFRLYARRLEQVGALSSELQRGDIEVRDHAEEIARVLLLDRNLSMILAIVAAIGGAGYVVSLGASLWAQVERKRRDLALLRLIGLTAAGLLCFPLVQALAVALAGSLLAALGFAVVALVVNGYFSAGLQAGDAVCRLGPMQILAAVGVTLLVALLAAGLAGRRAARVEPWEGLRDG